MPAPPPGQKQVNIRFRDDTVAVLGAEAYLRDATVTDVIKELVENYADSLAKDPVILDMVRRRAERAAEDAGTLARLDRKRNRKGDAG